MGAAWSADCDLLCQFVFAVDGDQAVVDLIKAGECGFLDCRNGQSRSVSIASTIDVLPCLCRAQ